MTVWKHSCRVKNKLNCDEDGEQPTYKLLFPRPFLILLLSCSLPTYVVFLFFSNSHTKGQNLFVQSQYVSGDCPQGLVDVAKTHIT